MSPRPFIVLLAALLASLFVPAVAHAQDTTPPVNTTAEPPAGWLDTAYQVELTATDDDSGVDHFEWRLNGSAEVLEAPGATVTVSAEGLHTLETRAFDVEGNASEWRADTVRIDESDPVDLTSPGTSAWRGTPATVVVGGTDSVSGIDHVEWRLDGGLLHSVPNASQVIVAADGEHVLSTRVVDLAGHASDWEDHAIRIDTVLPLDDTAAPSGWQTTPLVVTVAGSDQHSGIGLVRWRLDGGLTQSGVSGTTTTVTGDGEHTLVTWVQDAVGNTTGWKTHTIRIDTTAPANQTPAAPVAWRGADYAVMVSGADDGSGLSHVEWRVNGGPVTQGASPTQATVAGTGTHTLETRAVDVAGNASSWRVETLRIDKVVPTNTTAAAPSSAVPNPFNRAVTGTDAHAGVDRVEWRVDGSDVQSGPSGSQATVAGHGEHTLETRVVDAAGNASAWRSDDIEIDVALNGDTTRPTDTTTTAPAGWRTGPVNMTIAATDAGAGVERVEWRLDGQPVQSQAGASKLLTIADEGVHQLETRAWDLAGNVSLWRSQTVRLDFTVPEDTTAIGTGWQSTRAFVASGSDALSGIDEVQYRVGAGTVQSVEDGVPVTMVSDGSFTITHRVVDHAGHASPWKADTLKADTVLPANTSTVPGSAWRADALSHALSGTDDRSGLSVLQWRVDGGEIHDGGPAVVDSDGVHTLSTRAVDAAGNVSAWRDDTVRIDVTAPANDTPAAPDGWRAEPYTVEVAGSDGAGSGVAGIEVQVDDGEVSTAAEVTISEDGDHLLRTRVEDNVGRWSEWREEHVKIDSAAPTVSVACGGGAGWNPTPVACVVQADGGLSGAGSLVLDRAGTESEVAPGATVAVSTDGEHVLSATAVDGAGNEATSADARVKVDLGAPSAQVACEPAGEVYACRAGGSDAVSGLASLTFGVNGGAWQPTAADGTFTAPPGSSVRARAVDAAGHEAVTAPVALAAFPPPPAEPKTRARSASRPVYLRGRTGSSAMVGALLAARDTAGTVAVDLRPLALGRGQYRIKLQVRSGKARRTVTKTFRVARRGTSPRIRARLKGAVKRTTVTLAVDRRAGAKWRRHAAARVVLAK